MAEMTDDALADDFTASVSELHAVLLDTPGIDGFLQEMAAVAARRVTSGLSCGITLRAGGRLLTVASSDQLASQLDEVQYSLDNGPCLSAMRSGEMVLVTDTAAEPRWGGFEALAAARGVGSSLSMPLTAEGQHRGAMNLYAPVPDAFGEAEIRRAEGFAGKTAGALTLAVRQAQQAELTGQLREALATRSVIDQALGMIMAQERCTSSRAFEVLRAASQNRNIKLSGVAAQIVEKISGEQPQPPPFREQR